VLLHKALYVRTCEADQHVAQENVRCHPSPVGVPAIEQSQDNTDPYPVERDGPALRVALEEEECRSRDASENGPPVVVFREEMAEMANCNRNDCGGLQPVGIVNWRRLVELGTSRIWQLLDLPWCSKDGGASWPSASIAGETLPLLFVSASADRES